MMLIEGKDLTIGYDGEAIARNLSFSVEEGDYLCIVGENGSGKSTFVKTVLGLLEPLGGKISYSIQRNGIGYLPQQAGIQRDFPSSVMEVVLSGCLNRHRGLFGYTRSEKEKAGEILESLGMEDRKGSSYQELSGGQQQRVLLARALMAADKLLLLDEPVASLDTHTSSEFYHMVDQLNSRGTAIMMVTHDIHPLINTARTVLHFSHGGESFFGEKEEYLESEPGKLFLKEAGHDHD